MEYLKDYDFEYFTIQVKQM